MRLGLPRTHVTEQCLKFLRFSLMPSQRLVRHQSLLQRLSSYPQDLLLSLNETYELLEWDSISDTFSIPIGVALNAIYLVARLDQHDHKSSYHEKDIFEASRTHSSGVFGEKSGGIHTLVWCQLSWLILVVPYFLEFHRF
jgi:hypothetical protein